MKRARNHETYLRLRRQFPVFTFQSYSFSLTNEGLEAEFVFDLSDKFVFGPRLRIPSRAFYRFEELTNEQLGKLVFHVGMVEVISYWKAACPPKLIVRPHALEKEQVDWWKKLYFHGLGEFFYLNGIDAGPENFMEISSGGPPTVPLELALDPQKALVPVGGGKDSVVTLELLQNKGFGLLPFVLNPRAASERTLEIAGFSLDEAAVVYRTIDPLLLQLNSEGFLNGHTPFSALLACTAALVAVGCGAGNIALSNESSASQSTVPGTKINHQYSKSFEFEQDFAGYARKYLDENLSYFSFLRPVNELQIARLFAGFPQHFRSFRSCNAGSKTDSWCGHCPKCLFTFIMLSPFIPEPEMQAIFGKNLLEDEKLLPVFEELTGKAAVKPFECVGTPDEVNAALARTVSTYGSKPLPALLKYFKEDSPAGAFELLLNGFETQHLLTDTFSQILKDALFEKKKSFRDFLAGYTSRFKNVLILGFGREGRSSYQLLRMYFPELEMAVADRQEKPAGLETLESDERTRLFLGKDYLRALPLYDLVLKAPGIPVNRFAETRVGAISSQTDLFLQHFGRQTIGVTGTKGKSTTASLIAHLLKAAGRRVVLLGNIGQPAFDFAEQITTGTVVVFELSAHQLEYLHSAPKVAVLLNIFPEHLDHFGNFERYRRAKLNIFDCQNPGDTAIAESGFTEPGKTERWQTFGLTGGEDTFFRDGKLFFRGRQIPFDREKFPLRGKHNLKNALAALLAVSAFGVNAEQAAGHMRHFRPLPHRLEFVGERGGFLFYNDSISTVPESTMAAVETLQQVDALILGGYDRGIDYAGLVRFLQQRKIENLFLLGKAGARIQALFNSRGGFAGRIFPADNLLQVLGLVKEHCRKGCTVLLSPAAASYDQYHNFEHRGDAFRALVRKMFA